MTTTSRGLRVAASWSDAGLHVSLSHPSRPVDGLLHALGLAPIARTATATHVNRAPMVHHECGAGCPSPRRSPTSMATRAFAPVFPERGKEQSDLESRTYTGVTRFASSTVRNHATNSESRVSPDESAGRLPR